MYRSAVAIAFSLLGLLAWAQSAAEGQTANDCATLEGAAERLACYDNLFRPNEQATPTRASEPAATTAPGPAPVEPLEENFGREQTQKTKTAAPPPRLDEINSTITSITSRAWQEMAFHLENGQVWAQVSYRYLTIREGDRVTVKRIRMGGYVLTSERGASTRVRRLR